VIDRVRRFIGYFIAALAAVSTVVGTIYIAMHFVDSRITAALNDPATVRRIAFAARPEMIIDQKGTVEIDRGAMDYIADIKVTPDPRSPLIADSIVITPKRYMAHPPLVTSVDASLLHAEAERGQKLDWIIKLQWSSTSDPGPNRLRIEIIDR
jgi:hypothetical protein